MNLLYFTENIFPHAADFYLNFMDPLQKFRTLTQARSSLEKDYDLIITPFPYGEMSMGLEKNVIRKKILLGYQFGV